MCIPINRAVQSKNSRKLIFPLIRSLNHIALKWEEIGDEVRCLVRTQNKQVLAQYFILESKTQSHKDYKYTLWGRLVGDEECRVSVYIDERSGAGHLELYPEF
jgi:CRISPR/Cas system-associated protein Cas5 (RAMP superfamily)